MHPNQLYLYLNYVLESKTSPLSIQQCIGRSKQNYLFLPLDEYIQSFTHSEYGEMRILNPHLTCFEQLGDKSFFSDLHFSCLLKNSTDEIKIHIYQNEEEEIIGTYVKNLIQEEKPCIFSFDDLKILNDCAKKWTTPIRHNFKIFLEKTEQEYIRFLRDYRLILIREQDDLELQNQQLRHMVEKLEILNIFNPENYHQSLEKYTSLIATQSQLLEQQSQQAPIEVGLPARLEGDVDFSKIIKIRERGYVLKHVLNQQVTKLTTRSGTLLTFIHKDFEIQVKESIKLYQAIQEDLETLNPGSMSFLIKRRFDYCQTHFADLLERLKETCSAYFNTMVVTQQYQDFNLIEPYLNRPSAPTLRNIIKQDAAEILIRLINKFEISIKQQVLDVEPASILEYAIKENKLSVFAELVYQFGIDYTFPLSKNRPLALLITRLNKELAWKLIENEEIQNLSEEETQLKIADRNEFMLYARKPESRTQLNRLMPGALKGLSEINLLIGYEYCKAAERVKVINQELAHFNRYSLSQNMALIEEKHRLLLKMKVCNIATNQYSQIEVFQNCLRSLFLKESYAEKPLSFYARLPRIPEETIEYIRIVKENMNLFFTFLPGNSFNIIVKIYLKKIIDHFLEHSSEYIDETARELVDFVTKESERVKLPI
jgi:hypothetical protein